MNPNIAELAVAWTARIAVLAWFGCLLRDLSSARRGSTSAPVARGRLLLWTAGCLAFLLHVAAAFCFVHHGSHAAALAHTARQTYEVTGWNWGGGLWVNYAMTLWWPLDVILSWKYGLDGLPRWYRWTLHTFFGFLIFNATVVFGPPGWRWLAVPATLLLWVTWLRSPVSPLQHPTPRTRPGRPGS